MADIEAGPQSIRDAAAATREAADVVRGTTFAKDITGLVAAIPGARAAATSERLGAWWHIHVRKWAAFMDARADALDAAAERLEANEEARKSEFDRTLPPERGPR